MTDFVRLAAQRHCDLLGWHPHSMGGGALRGTGLKLIVAASGTVALGLFTNWASEESPGRWWWAGAAMAAAVLLGFLAAPGLIRKLFRRRPVDLHVAYPVVRAAQRGGAWWALPLPLDTQALEKLNRNIDFSDSASVSPDVQLTRWVYANQGGDVGRSHRRIVIQGAGQAATITGMRARVLARSAVLNGTFIAAGLGGGLDPIQVDMDLDSDHPDAAYFSSQVITIAADETVVVDLYAEASRSTVTWDLEIDFVVSGNLRTITVPSRNSCLRTSGKAGVDVWSANPEGYSANDHYGTTLYANRREIAPWIDEPQGGFAP
ncbi:hypothetical protein [Streptomyces sp. NPDC017941]|uniref:hypothetical protein n=1 Tax=Streptomyces sp. NPDC017941 TaxID=3365018 RepID=UPI0037A82A83